MYNYEEEDYLGLVHEIMEDGIDSDDRTGVGTRSLFAPMTLHFNLEKNVMPVITSRRTFFRGAVEEFLWMLRGETDANILKNKDVHIWDGNTTKEFIEKRGLSDIIPEGNIGTLYGYQLRNWNAPKNFFYGGNRGGIDQLQRVVDILKKDPTSRRAVISFYNVEQIDTGVLEPCHLMYIFYVDQKSNQLYCHLTIRSWDVMCGGPINIIWTALFTRVVASLVGLEAGGIAITPVNAHVYKSHFEKAYEQIHREPFPFPTVDITKEVKTISDAENLEYKDFKLYNYMHHSSIKYPMAI
jgi:thymidylate synthase